MIPKKIHYCWFWKWEKSPLMQHCIESWKRYNPNYEIIEWNESNCDLNSTIWVRQAYAQKKWAFVADYFRIEKLVQYGWVYCDTDAEIILPFDSLLKNIFFMSFQRRSALETHIIWSESWISILRETLDFYQKQSSFQMITINEIMTNIFIKRWMALSWKEQIVDDIYHIYPSNVLSFDASDGLCFAKHHHINSWMPWYTGKWKLHHQRMVRIEYFLSKHPKIAYLFDILNTSPLWAYIRTFIMKTRIFISHLTHQ